MLVSTFRTSEQESLSTFSLLELLTIQLCTLKISKTILKECSLSSLCKGENNDLENEHVCTNSGLNFLLIKKYIIGFNTVDVLDIRVAKTANRMDCVPCAVWSDAIIYGNHDNKKLQNIMKVICNKIKDNDL
jgi:hypothetical protein